MSKPDFTNASLFVVVSFRGRRKLVGYGARLKDAIAAAGVRVGEGFAYRRYKSSGVVEGEWRGKTWVRFA